MNICPAILTNNINIFRENLRSFQIFDEIDVDIIVPGNLTSARKTVPIQDAITEVSRFRNKKYKFHLMCDFPFNEIQKVKDRIQFLNIVFIIHQESSFDKNDVESSKAPIGIALKYTTNFRSLEYYENFCLVQIMSVEIGKQQNAFEPISLQKVTELRELGYDREVALDGGINLENITYIAKYDINSLSVGSYFTKSLNVITDKEKIEDEIELHVKK